MMKEVVFILSSLCDSHYRKRVEEFVENGYNVAVYGFKRKGLNLQPFPCKVAELGEISNLSYFARLPILRKGIKSIAEECKGKVCFYSSLDVALFARIYVKSNYIYEICDLTELTISNTILRYLLVKLNERVIKKSIITILTSEGFLDFYNNIPRSKGVLVPNKVSLNCPPPIISDRADLAERRLQIGFVGVIRYKTIYNFIKVCSEQRKDIDIHLFGIYSQGDKYADEVRQLEAKCKNIFYHGPFLNPNDLPSIYSQIDMLLCTYTPVPNVIYAEPNKLYESMYFKCPIIVSADTFLGKKVARMGIGYVVNALDELEIQSFVKTLDIQSYKETLSRCNEIDENECLNVNTELFNVLDSLL